MNNKKANYYIEIGSYNGAIKIQGKWYGAKNLHLKSSKFDNRWQGPPSKAIIKAMKCNTLINL